MKECVYIVTGASRGFGLAIAEALLAAGARVGLVSRGQAALDEQVERLGAERVFAAAADVADANAVRAAFTAVRDHFGRLDGVINNAGLARPNKVEHLDEAELMLQVNTNFVGTVLCCQAAIGLLRGGENPRIINISSASAWHTDEMSHLSIYAATKAGVERFTRDLRDELQHDGIGVTCVRPGSAWTSFSEGWNEQALGDALAAWMDNGKYMDIGMDVAQVADAVVYSLQQPPGVAVDLLEVRPFTPAPKDGGL